PQSSSDLDDAEQVALAVLEPGRLRSARGGDARLLVEPGEVVGLEDHAPGLQIAHLSADFRHGKAHLRVRARRDALARKEEEARAAGALVERACRVLLGG